MNQSEGREEFSANMQPFSHETGHVLERLRRRRDWLKYAIGATLAYGNCAVFLGGMLSSELSEAIVRGLLMGVFLFALVGPIHFLFQLLAHWFIARFWRQRRLVEGVLLNLPALLLLGYLLVLAAIPKSPPTLRTALARHLEATVPDSVKVKGYRFSRGLNEGDIYVVFTIGEGDLDAWLRSVGFAIERPDLDENTMASYRKRAADLAKGRLPFDAPGTLYAAQTNYDGSRGIRHEVVVGSNRQDVFLHSSFP